MHLGFLIVLLCQFAAFYSAVPYATFALRPWLVGTSLAISALLIASLTFERAYVPLQVLAFAGCAGLALMPRVLVWRARRKNSSADELLELHPPFLGRWRAAAAGPDPLLNHHLVARDQLYACDFIAAGGSLGRPILAPVDGEVVEVSDGMLDRPPSWRADDASVKDQPFGNYVILKVEDDAYVVLCHLQLGSISVRTGQRVAQGETLARCGNSGRSTGPHLHIHAQTTPQPAPFEATGVPIGFRDQSGALCVVVTGDWLDGGRPLSIS